MLGNVDRQTMCTVQSQWNGCPGILSYKLSLNLSFMSACSPGLQSQPRHVCIFSSLHLAQSSCIPRSGTLDLFMGGEMKLEPFCEGRVILVLGYCVIQAMGKMSTPSNIIYMCRAHYSSTNHQFLISKCATRVPENHGMTNCVR